MDEYGKDLPNRIQNAQSNRIENWILNPIAGQKSPASNANFQKNSLKNYQDI
jgi:hypothetical protein